MGSDTHTLGGWVFVVDVVRGCSKWERGDGKSTTRPLNTLDKFDIWILYGVLVQVPFE